MTTMATKVTDVFVTTEVANQLGVTTAYVNRLVKNYGLLNTNNRMVRQTAQGLYLFTQEGVDALRALIGRLSA